MQPLLFRSFRCQSYSAVGERLNQRHADLDDVIGMPYSVHRPIGREQQVDELELQAIRWAEVLCRPQRTVTQSGKGTLAECDHAS